MTANIHDTVEIDRLMQELQDTDVFRVEWKKVLPSGPRSMSRIGACFVAARAQNPHLSLVGSPESTHGLDYTTLVGCVLQVYKKGIEAFRLTLPRMSSIYQMAGRIFRILEDVITCIQGLPNAQGLQVLQAKLTILSRLTDQSATDAKNVGTEFLAWVATIGELRCAVLFKRDGSLPPPPPPTPPPSPPPPPLPLVLSSTSVPTVPSLPSVTATDLADMRQPLPDIQFWRDVPAMEACVRRTYKSLTSGRNSPDMYLLKSVEGVCYITGLFEQLKLYFEQVEKLVAGSPPYMAKTLVVLRYCLVNIRDIKFDPLDSWATSSLIQPNNTILRGWGLLHELARAAQDHLSLETPVDTWDRTDLMDAQYYPDYAPPTVTHLLQPAIRVRQPPRQLPASLVQFTTALDEAHSSAEKLGRFLSALSGTGSNTLTVEVQNFTFAAERLVEHAEAGPSSEQERADLIQLGQSVKAYFSITRAVAGMYNYVHQMYFDQGLELLHDLSLASTNAMRAARQRALETYCLRVATEIEVYVEGKKTRIIEELRGTMVGVAGRCG